MLPHQAEGQGCGHLNPNARMALQDVSKLEHSLSPDFSHLPSSPSCSLAWAGLGLSTSRPLTGPPMSLPPPTADTVASAHATDTLRLSCGPCFSVKLTECVSFSVPSQHPVVAMCHTYRWLRGADGWMGSKMEGWGRWKLHGWKGGLQSG